MWLWGGETAQASPVALGVKNPPANAGDVRAPGSVPGWGRSPAGGHGNPLQCYWLETPIVRGAWWAAVHRVPDRQTPLKRLTPHTRTDTTQPMTMAKGPLYFADVTKLTVL